MSGDLWVRFKNLMPEAPLEIGTIAAAYAGGVYLINKLGGGQLRVVSSSGHSIGQRVFVRGSETTGAAPDLPQVEIEI